jgi:leader peptidase (prepilin peptidase) / N-methyltransferase
MIEQIILPMYWYFLIVAGMFGAIIGSFLNVVIYRLPAENLSVVKPRSFCPECGNQIKWYDNLPLFSYWILRGKCRNCGASYSIRYFFVELTTAAFAVLFLHGVVGWKLFDPATGLIWFFLTCSLIAITFIDLDLQIIPNEISLPGIPIGLALSFFFMPHGIISSLIGVAVGGGILLVIAYSYLFITKKEGMGMGDVKLLAMLGAFLGWQAVPFTLFAASMVGTVVGVAFIIASGKGRHYRVPFGPFLSLGAVLYMFIGPFVIDWYLGR